MSSNRNKLTDSFLTSSASVSVLCIACFLTAVSPAAAKSSLEALNGSWAGGGTLTLESGKSEKISCNGYYKNSGGGQNVSVVIRCKGSPTNFELRSKFSTKGDHLSGSWEERTYHASGDASGSVGPGNLKANFSGSLTGSLSMSFSASSQSVSVSVGTKGAGIKGVRVNLSRH